jgi:hypothetical protein
MIFDSRAHEEEMADTSIDDSDAVSEEGVSRVLSTTDKGIRLTLEVGESTLLQILTSSNMGWLRQLVTTATQRKESTPAKMHTLTNNTKPENTKRARNPLYVKVRKKNKPSLAPMWIRKSTLQGSPGMYTVVRENN